MTPTQISKGDALHLTNELIKIIASDAKKNRKLFGQAKKQVSQVLGYKNEDDYFGFILTKANSDMSVPFIRGQAIAGEVERQLFGQENIGRMKACYLLPLYQYVEACNRKIVFVFARKGMNSSQYPSGKQIIEAAKKLGMYRKAQKSKQRAK